jgi:hypothetical protein
VSITTYPPELLPRPDPGEEAEVLVELDAGMDSTLAWRLGEIARDAGSSDRNDVGDPIDRGLILLRLLNLAGFSLVRRHQEARRG